MYGSDPGHNLFEASPIRIVGHKLPLFNSIAACYSKKVFNSYLQSAVYANGYRHIERNDNRRRIFFIVVHCGTLFCRINNPVFPNAGTGIDRVFDGVIHSAAGRRYNFHDPVRSTGAAPICELAALRTRICQRTDTLCVVSI